MPSIFNAYAGLTPKLIRDTKQPNIKTKEKKDNPSANDKIEMYINMQEPKLPS